MAGKKGVGGQRRGKGRNAKWIFDHVGYQGDDCLKWPFSTDKRVGRGTLGFMGRIMWAHRFMCELAHGMPPPDKPQASHKCGNGHLGCVNPRHLEWKSNEENSQDKITHGTTRKKGGKNLKPAQIIELKSLKGKMAQTAIAARFGVSLSCVQYHLHGKERWPSHNGR